MSTPLWTARELAEITGGQLQGEAENPVSGFSIDTRTLVPGEAYVAIKGDVHDGHKFTATALTSGASLAIVSSADDAARAAGPLLMVECDPLEALEQIARAARKRARGKVVAVTGSVGKTGTKEMLRASLSRSGSVHASQKSYNNHWGVPLTLANFPPDADFGVFEVGMNHPGEIVPLVDMIQPHVAIVTTVEAVHLMFFKSIDEIADAKAEIFTGVVRGGAAVLNHDNKYFERLKAAAQKNGIERIFGFGEHEDAEIQLEKVVLHGSCSCVQVRVMGMPVTYKLGAPGRHLVQNSLSVLATVQLLGADLALGAMALGAITAPEGRGARTRLQHPRGGEVTLIDEAYNANPASMRAALGNLGHSKPAKGGRRIVVLGDMLELGESSTQSHRELASSIDEAAIDSVYACGPMMAHLWDALPPTRKATYSQTSDGLTPALLEDIRAGDIVMIKGSLGSKMLPLVEAMKKRFPEHREATEQTG
jgi:UDP-N-acetylmuramoyl-tripeptide--D-alanyl-D-alanine ligase